MRLIDADALEELFREVIGSLSRKTDCNLNFEYMIRTSAMTIEMIKDAPTIVEFEGDINKVIVKGEEYHKIVRCKDCKFWDREDDKNGYCAEMGLCEIHEKHYCGWGRRSDDSD